MTIAPILQSVSVKLPPDRAFAVFTTRIGQWWAKGRTIGANPHEEIVIEPHVGGRWYERDAEGIECDWGKVLAWDPPHRLLLAWHLNASFKYNLSCVTEVEVTFEPEGNGTRVTLEHRNLERFGPSAEKVRAQIGSGWPKHLQEFADYADEHANENEGVDA